MERTLSYWTISLLLLAVTRTIAIEVTPATDPGDAVDFAGDLVDPGSPITVNSASFQIDMVGGGTALSELRAIGTFIDGSVGGQLPMINWLDPQESISYTNGIGMDVGVCLCTGLVTDNDDAGDDAVEGSGVGVQGPNNGFPISAFLEGPPAPSQMPLNAGEVSFVADTPRDRDFAEKVKEVEPTVEGDATVLQFEISLSSPGFLRISFVFASDEHPFWLNVGQLDVNDSMAIFIRNESCPDPEFKNIAVLNTPADPEGPMSLRELRDCDGGQQVLFLNNQVVPSPDDDLIPDAEVFDFPTSEHGFDTDLDELNTPDDGVPYYNHEFGGFSKVLTRETPSPLAPGQYTIKIVVQDVFDRKVDSAVFLEAGSLKLFTLRNGDYNGDGCVDSADYGVWASNFGATDATFYDGDGNGDCTVNIIDYLIWRDSVGASGNTDFRADFNRDGQVNGLDSTIISNYFNVLNQCASRFEGDTNDDGKVDSLDVTTFLDEFGLTSCGCACGEMMSGEELAALKAQVPDSPDLNGDGTIDETEFAALDMFIFGADGPASSAEQAPWEAEENYSSSDVNGAGPTDEAEFVPIATNPPGTETATPSPDGPPWRPDQNPEGFPTPTPAVPPPFGDEYPDQ